MERVPNRFRQREIVLIPVVYSDLSSSKIRPAIVISNDKYNKTSADLLCCAITTKKPLLKQLIRIKNKDMQSGRLKRTSHIKADMVFTSKKSNVIRSIGRLNGYKFTELMSRILSILEFRIEY